MREIRWSWSVAACSCVLVWSSVSFGQADAVAEKLFRQAVDYMKADDFAGACPLLERSYQLDPKDGTLFTLANCRDREEKLTAAVGHYRAYVRVYEKMSGTTRQNHKGRADNAAARIAEIETILPKVKFVWETPPAPESKIIVDGVEFRASTLDVLLPLDPGEHKIVVQLPGEPDRTRTVMLAKGGSTIIDLTPAKPEEIKEKSPGLNGGKGKGGQGDGGRNGKSGPMDPLKFAGFAGIGLGAAGVVTGSVMGILAMEQKETVDVRCTGNYVCDAVGIAAVDRFRTMGNVSTVSFIAGGVLAGAGVTFLLVSRRSSTATAANVFMVPVIVPGSASLTFEGAF
jgi:hypothetical protein